MSCRAPDAPNGILRFSSLGTIGCVFLLPLVLWPNIGHPFSTPKWLLLGGWGTTLLAVFAIERRSLQHQFRAQSLWALAGWIAALSLTALTAPGVSLDSMLAAIAPLPLYLALRASMAPPQRIVRMMSAASALISVIALLQYAGMDPFVLLLGWRPERFSSPRMAVYATLGNPDFVAAWLSATLPLAWAGIGKPTRAGVVGSWMLFAVQLLAIIATGSRVLLPAMGAAAMISSFCGLRHTFLRLVVIGVPACLLLFWLTPARSLPETIKGRRHIAEVVLSHAREVPAFGFGPGSFPAVFAHWQPAAREGPGPDDSTQKYAAPLDHAHNDYLEVLVEWGWVGCAAFGLMLGMGLFWAAKAFARSGSRQFSASILSGLGVLLVIAIVDFPLHRPAEWGLLWILFGLAHSRLQTKEVAETAAS